MREGVSLRFWSFVSILEVDRVCLSRPRLRQRFGTIYASVVHESQPEA